MAKVIDEEHCRWCGELLANIGKEGLLLHPKCVKPSRLALLKSYDENKLIEGTLAYSHEQEITKTINGD